MICAVEINTNSYSVPWRLIGERVAVTIVAGEVRIRHGLTKLRSTSNRMDAGCGSSTPLISMVLLVAMARSAGLRSRRRCRASSSPPSLLRPLAEYEAVVGGSF